jgi:hypothetical protein
VISALVLLQPDIFLGQRFVYHFHASPILLESISNCAKKAALLI